MVNPNKYFATVEEFWPGAKVKRQLVDIIAIATVVVICGCENWYGIEGYSVQKQLWLSIFLVLLNGVTGHDTYRWLFYAPNLEK